MKQLYKYILTLVAIFVVTANVSAQTYNGGTWYSLYDANEYSISVFGSKTFDIFTPMLGNLTFEAKRTTAGQGNLQLIPIVNGADQSAIFSNKLNTSYTSYSLTLSNQNTTQLKFYAPTGVTLKKYFKNIKLPLAKHILLNDNTTNGQTWGVSSITLTDNSLATAEGKTSTSAYTIQFRSFLASGDITITSSNPEFHFGNGQTSITLGVANNYCASANGSGNCSATTLGQISNYSKQVYFSPAVQHNKNNRSTKITISDGTSTAYIYLSAPVIPTYFFKAEAIASPAEGGTATATFSNGQDNCSVIATNYTTTSMSATVTFTATPKTADGYVFEGWKTDPASTTFHKQGADQTTITETITSSALNPNGLASQLTLYAIYSRRYTAKITGSNYTNKLVNDSLKADYQFINTQTAIPTNSEADPFYFKIEHNFTGNDTREGSPRPDEVIAYDPTTNTITALNEGTATITFYQKNTDSHEPVSESFTVQVIKHTPSFALKSDPLYFNKEYPDYFTTNANSPLTITSSDELVAKWEQGSNPQSYTLKTFSKTNTATLTAIQHENYYWARLEGSIDIQLQDPNNHVPFTIDTDAKRNIFVSNYVAPGYSWNNGIQLGDAGDGFNYNDKYVDIKFSGYPDKLTFNTSVVEAGLFPASDIYWYVKESVDGMTWSDVVWSEENTKQVSLEKPIQLKPETQYIRLCYSGNFGGVFHNIKVSELKQFSAVDKVDGDKHLDFGANQVQSTKTVKFDLKYANVGYKVSATSNNSRFKVTPAINTEIGGERYGTYEYSVSYTSDVLYETVGDESYIELTDELGNSDRIYLHASSYKASQNITWRADFAAVDEPAIRKSDGQITNAAKASSGLTVTYTSEDPDIIEVIDDGKVLLPRKAGRVKITASQAGNSDTWEAASDEEKWFIVTDKMLQYILWSDALTDLTEDDINTTKVLGAKVYVQVNAEGYEVEYSESQTGKIEYTSADNRIVSVEGNILTIHSTGQTTLTVTVAEDKTYAAVSLVVPVMVKAKPVGCADELLLDHKDEVSFFAYNTNEIVQGPFAIDRDKGVPGTLEFQHYGASWDLGIQYYSGTIKAQYTTDDNSNWVDAKEVTPKEDQATTETGIALPRNATQIRFVRPSGGTGYHYVSNIQVHPAQYLETEDNVEEVNFGEILIGSTVTTSLNINYSNIKSEIYPVLSSNELSTDPVVFGQCGAFGTQTLNISWRPSVASDAVEETLTLRDELTGMVKEVKLTAIVIKGEQKITWSRPGTITTCLEFPEETDVHVAVEWEIVSGEDCASFEGNMLNIYKSGNIQVKGSAAESDNYKAYSIVYNFVVDYNPTYIGDDGNWNDPSNWNICRVPLEEEAVTVDAPLELSTSVTVEGVVIAANGTIHITSTGGLSVAEGGIQGAKEDGSSIIIDNKPEGAGFLKVHPAATKKPAKVTINYTTAAYNSGNLRDEVWQYMGAPGEDMHMASDVDKTMIYHWDEVNGWVYQTGAELEPFVGYAMTQSKGSVEAPAANFVITAEPIISSELQEIDLTVTEKGMGGSNLFVNSYLAPIDLTKFDSDDFEGEVIQTFYLFNSGSWKQWQEQGGKNEMTNGSSPGQYYAINPLGAALLDKNLDQTTIPPMQGVYVVAQGTGGKIKLNYLKHVYGAPASNKPMRAPEAEDESIKRVRLQVNSDNSGADRMYVIQYASASSGYDNGYDAENIAVDGQVSIYTDEKDGQMEISVSDKIDSTYIGFQAGSDSEYRLYISSVVGEELYLQDLENDSLISLVGDDVYTFHATPGMINDRRFLLLDHANESTEDGSLTTGIEDVQGARIWVAGKMVCVDSAPMNSRLEVYAMGGLLVGSYAVGSAPCTVDLSHLSTGVYVLRLNDIALKMVCK